MDASRPFRKTKIIVTLGESSSTKDVLVNLIRAGMDIARISNRFLKMDKQLVLDNLKQAMEETGVQVGVMVGLRESDIRIGCINRGPLRLKKGDIVRITTNIKESEKSCSLWCNNAEFHSMVSPGDKLLVDFGKIILTVLNPDRLNEKYLSKSQADFSSIESLSEQDNLKEAIFSYNLSSSLIISGSRKQNLFPRHKKTSSMNTKPDKIVRCQVENDSIITVHKPVYISSEKKTEIPMSAATVAEDFEMIQWATQNNIDFIVFKQATDKEDLDCLLSLSSSSAKKILGVQNNIALTMFEEAAKLTDGVLIGRGTLALETSLADVCKIQKKIVDRCNELAKPVIISTQLLENMVLHNSPARSEVTDITNAVLDGADALLLSAETAYGQHPVKALEACSSICIEAEKYLDHVGKFEKIKKMLGKNMNIVEITCFTAVTTVLSTNAKLIVCLTESGRTAQIISRFMPPCIIVALTNSQTTQRQMRIIRGVYPFYVAEEAESEILEKIYTLAKTNSFASQGDFIVLVGGVLTKFAVAATCSLKILIAK